jgi:hypothetical protein
MEFVKVWRTGWPDSFFGIVGSTVCVRPRLPNFA